MSNVYRTNISGSDIDEMKELPYADFINQAVDTARTYYPDFVSMTLNEQVKILNHGIVYLGIECWFKVPLASWLEWAVKDVVRRLTKT